MHRLPPRARPAGPGDPGVPATPPQPLRQLSQRPIQQLRVDHPWRLTGLGYGPAAKCSDCHGSHGILAVSNPNSTLSPANRAATCGKCHPHASGNFLNFDPHVDHLDASRGGIVRWTYLFFLTMLIATFGCFGLHSVLWFLRSLVDVFKHGRPRGLRAGQAAYVRFTAGTAGAT